jgi:hypothetical protein
MLFGFYCGIGAIKVKAFVERGDDGTYGVYIDLQENRLTYSLIGDGNTVEEAIGDFYNSYEEMKLYYTETGKDFQEAEFVFHGDGIALDKRKVVFA